MELSRQLIAVDFDGTIVEDKYPQIGKERIFAFDTLKALQSKGYMIILWTCRSGQLLTEAVEFCRQHGVEFYAVNSNYQGEIIDGDDFMRKIDVDMYIDDRNYGGIPSWGEIYQTLCPDKPVDFPKKNKSGLLNKIFKRD